MPQFFRLVSEFQTINRRSFPFVDREVLNPNGVRPLIHGEFLQLSSGSTKGKMFRGGDDTVSTPGTPDNEATIPSYCYFAEQGRYEVQAIDKGPFLYMHSFEADTKVMDGDGLSIGSALTVWDIDALGGSIVRRGLAVRSSGYTIGYVTRLPADNNGWLRFIRVG
jgi:hypothetical protein